MLKIPQAERTRALSIKSAQTAAAKAEQNRQIALRELQNKNIEQQIKATTAQNKKVKQNIESAGYDSSKLQRAKGRPSPRKESVSNPEQRRFAQRQVDKRVSETIPISKQQSAAQIRETHLKERRAEKIQQAQQRYTQRQKIKITATPKPTKFPEPIKYSNAGTIAYATGKELLTKSTSSNSQFDEFVKNNF